MARQLHFHTVVAAPVDQVWEVLAERFADVGTWASTIPHSHGIELTDGTQGRVCATTLPGIDQVTERMLDRGDTAHTLSYLGAGLPFWMGDARNHWYATAIDAERTRVGFRPEVRPHGFGRLLAPIMLRDGGRMAVILLDDLRMYLETGRPSPRKQRAEDRAKRKRPPNAIPVTP